MAGNDELEARLEQLGPEDFERGLRVFHEKLGAPEASYLQTCVHCGLCADSCHYYRSDGELESIPAHKLGQVVSVFKRRFGSNGATLTNVGSAASSGARQFFAVAGGGFAGDPAEDTVEVAQALKARRKSDFTDAQVGIEQEISGFLHTHPR